VPGDEITRRRKIRKTRAPGGESMIVFYESPWRVDTMMTVLGKKS
jgi:16S rRNA C1402 (ribose-2'-O) methylase RsmI